MHESNSKGRGLTSNGFQVLEVQASRRRVRKKVDVGEREEAAVTVVVLLGQFWDLFGWNGLDSEVRCFLRVFLVPAVCYRALFCLLQVRLEVVIYSLSSVTFAPQAPQSTLLTAFFS